MDNLNGKLFHIVLLITSLYLKPMRDIKPKVLFCILVPLWSGVNVAGVLFRDVMPNIGLDMDQDGWNELMKDVTRAWVSV